MESHLLLLLLSFARAGRGLKEASDQYNVKRDDLSEGILGKESGEGGGQDSLPWSDLEELAELEKNAEYTIKVIVLTMNRPESLERLLKSLSATAWEFDSDSIQLEIHVDKDPAGGWLHRDCIRLAEAYQLPPGRGNVSVRVANQNIGLRAAWFDAWWPESDTEHAIIVEDDLELAPLWFSWLRRAWLSYRQRDDVAGIALSRQFLMFQKPERSDMEIENENVPFLYKLVGTWAFSPHPKQWRSFLTWFRSLDSETFDPYVPGLITSDWLHIHTKQGRRHMTWEQWHVYHSEQQGLFTLYINLPDRKVLANNWREAGVHSRTSPGYPDYPLEDGCPIQLQEFPSKLRKYGWDAKEIL